MRIWGMEHESNVELSPEDRARLVGWVLDRVRPENSRKDRKGAKGVRVTGLVQRVIKRRACCISQPSMCNFIDFFIALIVLGGAQNDKCQGFLLLQVIRTNIEIFAKVCEYLSHRGSTACVITSKIQQGVAKKLIYGLLH